MELNKLSSSSTLYRFSAQSSWSISVWNPQNGPHIHGTWAKWAHDLKKKKKGKTCFTTGENTTGCRGWGYGNLGWNTCNCLKGTKVCAPVKGWKRRGPAGRECVEAAFTPTPLTTARKATTRPLNVFLIYLIRWRDDISIQSCVCACLWDLMDFPQDIDKPALCGVQNAYIADSSSDSKAKWRPHLLSENHHRARLNWTFASKQRRRRRPRHVKDWTVPSSALFLYFIVLLLLK